MNPTEHQIQVALLQWAAYQSGTYPELNLMFAIPNGGKRDKAVAAKLKPEGVKPGVPDICLPVPRREFHGLFLELKRDEKSRVRKEQKEWLAALRDQGYMAEVARGFDAALNLIQIYLEIPS